MKTLKEYINSEHGGSQVECAKRMGVSKQQMTRYLREDMLVIDGKLYLFRRKMNGAIST